MAVEYRELSAADDLGQCLEFQRQVFGYSETDLVSPLILKMIVRDNPPLGILVGAFDVQTTSSTLLGLMVGLASFREKEVHVALGGVLPAWQAGPCGYRLLLAFRQAAMARGLKAMSALHDPLEEHLARLYYGGIGYQGYGYHSADTSATVPADKVLARWDFTSPHTLAKLARHTPCSLVEMLAKVPLVHAGAFVDAPRVLFLVPNNFSQLKAEQESIAATVRLECRMVFHEYLNCRGYVITDCISGRINGLRRSYYLMEKY